MAKQVIYECWNRFTKKIEATFCIRQDAELYCKEHPSCDWRAHEFEIYVGGVK